jgi:hypothetical protein
MCALLLYVIHLAHTRHTTLAGLIESLVDRLGEWHANALVERYNGNVASAFLALNDAQHVLEHVDKEITDEAIERHKAKHPESKSDALGMDDDEEEQVTAEQRMLFRIAMLGQSAIMKLMHKSPKYLQSLRDGESPHRVFVCCLVYISALSLYVTHLAHMHDMTKHHTGIVKRLGSEQAAAALVEHYKGSVASASFALNKTQHVREYVDKEITDRAIASYKAKHPESKSDVRPNVEEQVTEEQRMLFRIALLGHSALGKLLHESPEYQQAVIDGESPPCMCVCLCMCLCVCVFVRVRET